MAAEDTTNVAPEDPNPRRRFRKTAAQCAKVARDGHVEDHWCRVPDGEMSDLWILYRGYFGKDESIVCGRRVIVAQSDSSRVLQDETRGLDISELQITHVERWYRQLLGTVMSAYRVDGSLMFLTSYRGYESRDACLVEVGASARPRMICDGRRRGC